MAERIALAIDMLSTPGGGPPSEFRLFKAGLNRTIKGDFVYSERSERACAEFARERAVQSLIDYEHASLSAKDAKDPAEAGKAAGWFDVDARPDGVYATRVTWTKRASEALAAREFRYFSPVVFFDAKTREVTGILNAALTGNPATFDQEPLVASIGAESASNRTPDPGSTNACTPPSSENPPMKTLLALLSLPADATEVQALSVIEKMRTETAVFLSLTGKGTIAEAAGTIAAWKESAGQVTALSARVAELEGVAKKSEVDALVEGAISAKKATPAMREHLSRMGTRDPAELRAFISAMPTVAAVAAVKEPAGAPVEASLSATDKGIAAMFGTDLSALAANKAANAKA